MHRVSHNLRKNNDDKIIHIPNVSKVGGGPRKQETTCNNLDDQFEEEVGYENYIYAHESVFESREVEACDCSIISIRQWKSGDYLNQIQPRHHESGVEKPVGLDDIDAEYPQGMVHREAIQGACAQLEALFFLLSSGQAARSRARHRRSKLRGKHRLLQYPLS